MDDGTQLPNRRPIVIQEEGSSHIGRGRPNSKKERRAATKKRKHEWSAAPSPAPAHAGVQLLAVEDAAPRVVPTPPGGKSHDKGKGAKGKGAKGKGGKNKGNGK